VVQAQMLQMRLAGVDPARWGPSESIDSLEHETRACLGLQSKHRQLDGAILTGSVARGLRVCS
jgi:hypothetical protein